MPFRPQAITLAIYSQGSALRRLHVSAALMKASKDRLPSSVREPKQIFLNITATRSARSASLLVGGRPGFLANAATVPRSFRISFARDFNFS